MYGDVPRRDRLVTLLGVGLLHAGALWLLFQARSAPAAHREAEALTTFTVPRPMPANTVRATSWTERARRPPAPPGRRARRDPLVVPPAVLPLPSPMTATPLADIGTAAAAGAAEAGAGPGAQWAGDGAGGGGTGRGSGGTRARLIAGAIRDRDYPRAARAARREGSVTVRFTVSPEGRVHDCIVAHASGDAALDAATCRLIERRFRYAPARDATGTPVAEQRGWRQDWWLEPPVTQRP